MSAQVITELDPFDEPQLTAWHAAYAEASSYGRGATAPVWTLPEMRVTLQDQNPENIRRAFSGTSGGRVVSTGYLSGSHRHNLQLCEVGVTTVPDARGQGHGAAMLAHVEQAARDAGRTSALCEVAWPYDADPNGAGTPDAGFATARGFVLGLVDIQRQAPLPVDPGVLDRLAAEAAQRHEGYELRSFTGPVPDELVRGWSELSASLMTEAPMGDLEREPEPADVGAQRAAEEIVVKQGRQTYNTAAVSPDGEVVAYTTMATTVHEPGKAYQWGTLVRSDHRGHRLGLAVKVANTRLLQTAEPGARVVLTWNAEVNSHMIGVNEQLGFVPVERPGEFQKGL